MVWTASSGKRPLALSPESMTASAPSKTALATSLASARVGRGCCIIESSICVAMMTGLPSWLPRSTIDFCRMGTRSAGTSTPRSPRATMSPSAASAISSMFSSASGFSILAMIGTTRPSARSAVRASSTSPAVRTKERAT